MYFVVVIYLGMGFRVEMGERFGVLKFKILKGIGVK